MSDFEPQQSGISRRTVTKAMAWAVPAIAVAAPVPAFAAASQGIVRFTGRGCKDPGNSIPGVPGSKAYFVELTITNTTNAPVTVTFTGATVNGVAPINPPGFSATPGSTNVPANTVQTIVVRIANWADSANATIVLTYQVGGGPSLTTEVTLVDTPPIQGASCPLTYPYVNNAPINP